MSVPFVLSEPIIKTGVDPENVMIMGFSAGGHLCACVGACMIILRMQTHRYDGISARPDKICLSYPVISFLEDSHEGSCIHHLGRKCAGGAAPDVVGRNAHIQGLSRRHFCGPARTMMLSLFPTLCGWLTA